MVVLDHQGNNIDIASINWDKVTGRNFRHMIRQQPGPSNALGRIKIMFPNKHAVYLHDTPSKKKFNKSERAFSSGCIRVQKPFELAELLLGNSEKWNLESLNKIVETEKLTRIKLPKSIPVLVTYATVDFDIDQNQIVKFNPDIYSRDQPIINGLNKNFTFVAPANL